METAQQKFLKIWETIEKPTEKSACWPWTGRRNQEGYGYVLVRTGCVDGVVKRKMVPASHIAYEMFVGPIPTGLFICHHCDNPPCVRYEHFFPGTSGDNARDRTRKGRQFLLRGEQHHRAQLTTEQVIEIRQRLTQNKAHGQYTALAREFFVSRHIISDIALGKTWKHVHLP